MTHLAYLFQAKGIQRYILEGGKLKDMAGASELVARLCRSEGDDLLDTVLEASDFQPSNGFSRRAGGASMMHFDESETDAFERFRALWTLTVSLTAPGLEFADGLGKGKNFEVVKTAAREATGMHHNTMAHLLPMAGPLVRRAPRTGLAAVRIARDADNEPEALDVLTLSKRRMLKGHRVLERFEPDSAHLSSEARPPEGGWRWPVDLEDDFPFTGDKRWIGVIHADISNLGRLFNSLGGAAEDVKNAAAESLKRSKEIETAMTNAARKASAEVLAPKHVDWMMPARPILLGGDDLTILVRADLAVDYARVFLEALEQSEVAGQKLTACAGIAFIKYSQPFHMASALADSLCSHAKTAVKEGLAPGDTVPSALAFHRITASLAEDFDTLVEAERTVRNGNQTLILSQQPYLVGAICPKQTIPKLSDLEGLCNWFKGDGVSIGPLRNLQSLLFNDVHAARKGYGRWCNGMRDKEGVDFGAFDKALDEMMGKPRLDDLPFAVSGQSPLFDALDWRELS